MASRAKPIPEGYHAATPYLTVADSARAIEFYTKAFGAAEVMRIPGPSGKIAHAEIRIGDSRIMISDEFPNMGAHSPQSIGGSPVAIYLYLDDVDATAKRAVAAGATMLTPVEDKFYGDRAGSLKDPFGHRWHIATHKEDVPIQELRKRAEAMAKQHER